MYLYLCVEIIFIGLMESFLGDILKLLVRYTCVKGKSHFWRRLWRVNFVTNSILKTYPTIAFMLTKPKETLLVKNNNSGSFASAD